MRSFKQRKNYNIMKEALKELEFLIGLTGTLKHQTYLNNKLKLIKTLLENEQKSNNTKA